MRTQSETVGSGIYPCHRVRRPGNICMRTDSSALYGVVMDRKPCSPSSPGEKPILPIVSPDDHRHSVMDRLQHCIGGSCEQEAPRHVVGPSQIPAMANGAPSLTVKQGGELTDLRPLIKPIDGHLASAFGEIGFERQLLPDRSRPGVDQSIGVFSANAGTMAYRISSAWPSPASTETRCVGAILKPGLASNAGTTSK